MDHWAAAVASWLYRRDFAPQWAGPTLDGPELRLGLTGEAADVLETETVFEVRLDLPPEKIAEVRATVPRLFGPCVQGPKLIGF
ncbi:hypothetical protein [Nonomuraea sp. NPDC050643]|uniref:hypothetical protein n=1 Tax=Nonomuraea sp. NPDC050643 TaxID=3155660 RepID=UPI0033FB22E0